MSIATNIYDQLKDVILEEIPHLTSRFDLQQEIPEKNIPGGEFMRLTFEGGGTERLATGTADKKTQVRIVYYKLAGSRQKLDPTEIKEGIIGVIPEFNRPYWWSCEQIDEQDVTDFGGEQYEGFQLVYLFHTAKAMTCSLPDYLVDIDGQVLMGGDGTKLEV